MKQSRGRSTNASVGIAMSHISDKNPPYELLKFVVYIFRKTAIHSVPLGLQCITIM